MHPRLITGRPGAGAPITFLTPPEAKAWRDQATGAQRTQADLVGFGGEAGKFLLLLGIDGALDRVLCGLGEAPQAALIAGLAAQLPAGEYRFANRPGKIALAQAICAWALGGYRFDAFKTAPSAAARLSIADADLPAAADAARLARATEKLRNLVNLPANVLGPEKLAAAFEDLAVEHGAQCVVTIGEDLRAANYPLIHAVGRAGTEPPRLVELTWGDPSHPVVALVGKGVTFDTGGSNLKTGAGMRLMKKDMGGAAHVLALAQMAMEAKLAIRLVVLAPLVENGIGAGAMRPGDVIASRKGLSVEIEDTDAEGRLILADALTRAHEHAPTLLIDLATLTGAARVALGPEIAPFYTPQEALAAEIIAAAAACGELVWRMPLHEGYASQLDSPIADVKNLGDAAMAGSITAALFLKRFVGISAWAHWDIYAWNAKDRPGRPAGGEAFALNTLYHVISARATR